MFLHNLFKENSNYKENSTHYRTHFFQEPPIFGLFDWNFTTTCFVIESRDWNKEGQKMNKLIESLTTVRYELNFRHYNIFRQMVFQKLSKSKIRTSILQQEEHKETSKKKLFKEKVGRFGWLSFIKSFMNICAWRNAEATERLLPAYAILHQKALHGIAICWWLNQ